MLCLSPLHIVSFQSHEDHSTRSSLECCHYPVIPNPHPTAPAGTSAASFAQSGACKLHTRVLSIEGNEVMQQSHLKKDSCSCKIVKNYCLTSMGLLSAKVLPSAASGVALLALGQGVPGDVGCRRATRVGKQVKRTQTLAIHAPLVGRASGCFCCAGCPV